MDATANWQKYLKDFNGNGTWDLDQSRTTNKGNKILDITESTGTAWTTPAYSSTGNMTTIPQPDDLANAYTATYDAWNRIVRLTDGSSTVSEYEYDGSMRRILVKTYIAGSLDEMRHYYFTSTEKWQAIEERVDSFNTPCVQTVWGIRYIDDIVLRDRDTTGNGTLDERLYSLQDANWNVTTLTSTSGDVQMRFAYQPYGESLALNSDFTSFTGSDLKWAVRFTGRELDLASGLQVNRNRYLHLQLGCWLTRDPIGHVDGMNLYESHSVIQNVDPAGLKGLMLNDPLLDCIHGCEDHCAKQLPYWYQWHVAVHFPGNR